MILIDALYINEGGGKILLDYIIERLEEADTEIIYLLDERVRDKMPFIKSLNSVEFLPASLLKRHLFYKRNRNNLSKVFCFGNVPPTLHLKCQVFTYFQNLILLEVTKEYSLVEKVKFSLKRKVLKFFDDNTTFWLVQSDLIKRKLQSKFNVKPEKVIVLPFYRQFEKNKVKIIREKYTYIYVSNGTPHKNHIRLINVFCEFYDQFKKGKLILTINTDYPILIKMIRDKVKKGYPVENIGFVNRDSLQESYLKAEFLIFPSLTESFGLGLIEAIECGCKVIGADLPYTYEVCEPSIVFNPLNDASFMQAFESSLDENVKISIPKIKNNIHELITILKDNTCN